MGANFRCVGLGEVLWDILPNGRLLGGAPANFAYHTAALGADAHVVSRVGHDDAGRELLASLRRLGLGTEAIEIDPSAPTGTVTVGFGADGHPVYTIHETVAWDYLAGAAAGRSVAANADAICFGTLAQRNPAARAAIRRLLGFTRPESLRILDVNLRQHYYSADLIAESLQLANILKVNETELPKLREMFALPGDERAQIGELARRFRLRAVAYTRGGRGSLLHADGAWAEAPARPVKVADTVGAGDSFTAAFALGLLAGWPLPLILKRATGVATYVCSQPGATPVLPPGLRAPFLAATTGAAFNASP